MKRKIYVASSWKNDHQPVVVDALKYYSHEVYDFRHPKKGDGGFSWSQIEGEMGKEAGTWTPKEWSEGLTHESAQDGYRQDFDALKWCDTCLLVLPCGRSAHLELGWAIGSGRKTAIWFPSAQKWEGTTGPELMYLMADRFVWDWTGLRKWAQEIQGIRS